MGAGVQTEEAPMPPETPRICGSVAVVQPCYGICIRF